MGSFEAYTAAVSPPGKLFSETTDNSVSMLLTSRMAGILLGSDAESVEAIVQKQKEVRFRALVTGEGAELELVRG